MSEPKIEPHPEVDLSNVIADSKVQLSEVAPIKRGRGRPRKNPEQPSVPAPAPATTPTPDSAQPVQSIVPLLVPTLKAVSTIPASKYKVKELALSDDEATPLAQAMEQLINAYAPDLATMSPKTAAWLSFGMVTSSLFISKMQVYYANTEKTIETRPTQSIEKSDGPRGIDSDQGFVKPQGGLTLAADDYFKRPR